MYDQVNFTLSVLCCGAEKICTYWAQSTRYRVEDNLLRHDYYSQISFAMGKRKLQEQGNVNEAISDMLYELADYEKNITKNIYKYNAYRKAAQVLASHPVKIKSGEEARKLEGIGKKIAEKIDEFLATGKLPKLEEIKKNNKFKAIQLLTRVSGIGPAKAKQLVDQGIYTIADLEKVKDKLTHHQRIGLKYFYDFELKIPRSEVTEIEKTLISKIAEIHGDYIVTICGSYRRGKPTSGDVDCLITHPGYTSKGIQKKKPKSKSSLESVVEKLKRHGLIIDTIAQGPTKFMGVCRLKDGKPARRLDIRLTPHDQYFCSILYFTGSDLFNQNMRAHALEQGYTLNEYSLRPIGVTGVPGEPVPISSERDIFEYIDYPYKAPEERNL